MSREFRLPDLGEGIAEAQIVRLMVKEGSEVAEDQPLMEVETDKAAVEIPSPLAGVVERVHFKEGQTVNVGDVMVTFSGGAAAAASGGGEAKSAKSEAAAGGASSSNRASTASSTAAPPADRSQSDGNKSPDRSKTVPAAPAVRKMAREMGVDLASLSGSGPGGRVVREDVERAAAGDGAAGRDSTPSRHDPSQAPASARSAPAMPPMIPTVVEIPGTPGNDKWGAIRRAPMSQIRKTIATQMAKSVYTIPHVTHCDDADITDLENFRKSANASARDGRKLTLMPFAIAAVCRALRQFPIFNASFDDQANEIVYKEYINIGIAVDTPRGLVVPSVRDADRMGIYQIGDALAGVAQKARDSQFTIDDLRGGTFTITNVGAMGGRYSTPIINHPEVAILGMGRSRWEAGVHDGKVEPRFILPMSLAFDHRATDGAQAAQLTRLIVEQLENPIRMIL